MKRRAKVLKIGGTLLVDAFQPKPRLFRIEQMEIGNTDYLVLRLKPVAGESENEDRFELHQFKRKA